MPGQLSPVILPPSRMPVIATPTSGSDWLSCAAGIVSGSNDDTIIAARLAADGFVQLAPGTYNILTAALTPPAAGGGIVGCGRSTIIKRPDNTDLKQVNINGQSKFYLGHFELDGNKANNAGAGHWREALTIANCTDFTVEDVQAINVNAENLSPGERAAITFDTCSQYFVDKLYAFNATGMGIRHLACFNFHVGAQYARACSQWGLDFDAGCAVFTAALLDAQGNTKDGVFLEEGCRQCAISTIIANSNRIGVEIINNASATPTADIAIGVIEANGNTSHGFDIRSNANTRVTRDIIAQIVNVSANGGDGIRLDCAAGGTLSRVHILGGRSRGNTGWGVNIGATLPANCSVENVDVGADNVAGAVQNLSTNGASFVKNCLGFNPQGHAVAQPAVPASTVAQTNVTGADCMVYVLAGTVTVVAIDGVATGQIAGGFYVPAGHTIALTYTVAPTWQWFGV